jgi:hypothetical protein
VGEQYWETEDLGTITLDPDQVEAWRDFNVIGVPDRVVSVGGTPEHTATDQSSSENQSIDVDGLDMVEIEVDHSALQSVSLPKKSQEDTDSEIVLQIRGLSAFKSLPSQIQLEGTYKTAMDRRGAPMGEETGSWEMTVPRRISENALQAASAFLSEVGLDLDPEESTEYGIDFEDLE